MLELKTLSPEAVDSARKRAHHYRLLNHPFLAESICRDILVVKPGDHETLVTLVLALCDQFGVEGGSTPRVAMEIVKRFEVPYDRDYYAGIVCERMAFAKLRRGGIAAGHIAYDWFVRAMEHFDTAAEHRPAGNDDAILRWNTCARVLNTRPDVRQGDHDLGHMTLE
jgi:hypothetical protein